MLFIFPKLFLSYPNNYRRDCGKGNVLQEASQETPDSSGKTSLEDHSYWWPQVYDSKTEKSNNKKMFQI